MKDKKRARAIPNDNILAVEREEWPKSKGYRLRKVLRGAGITSGTCAAVLIISYYLLSAQPVIGAQGADMLRSLIGDKAVSGLEMKFNQMQDGLQKLKYQLGLEIPAAPWNTAQMATPAPVLTRILPATPEVQTPNMSTSTVTPAGSDTPEPTFTPTPTLWQPAKPISLGGVKGEGVWSAYIQDAEGYIVAYRTFLQPDPSRPYTLVAIVAIDLSRTRLHFVLGTEEPAGENKQPRTGAIPETDTVARVLLAAFNGGFKARHGEFGAMDESVMALPARDGLGTLLIYKDGKVSLVEWKPGSAITSDVAAMRQNGPLVIQAGQVNPRIYNNSPQDWGYTVNDVSPTVRTGIGLSADAKTLYYFCGPSLSMEALAKTMQAAGAWNAIQLDINNYWSLFVKFEPSGSKLIPEALLPRLMVDNVERYLWHYSRDYFYLTSVAR